MYLSDGMTVHLVAGTTDPPVDYRVYGRDVLPPDPAYDIIYLQGPYGDVKQPYAKDIREYWEE